ncbi:MAG: DUF1273 domain-containing protein [Clostridia bacterium]|nr:DUF1273 domain-containing protein [Clostridia bacterium]
MSEKELRLHRCCFTGHRPEKLNISERKVKALLKSAIEQAIKDGYTTFITGMARGIDMWAAEIVLKKRRRNANIHLICAFPFEGFESRWNATDRENYRDIIDKSDLTKYICAHYSPSCFQIRNTWMVDRSARVIAAYNGVGGGTRNTVVYAKRKHVEVKNILEEGVPC